MAITPDATARAMPYAIEQPTEAYVGDVVVRPTAQAQPCGSDRLLTACYPSRGSPAVLRRATKSRNARIAGGSCRRPG